MAAMRARGTIGGVLYTTAMAASFKANRTIKNTNMSIRHRQKNGTRRLKIPLPAQDVLLKIFRYDESTGDLVRIETGEVCSARDGQYIRPRVHGIKFVAHRIIFKMVTGNDPGEDLDHWDTDKQNNRWINLRPANRGQNVANSRAQSGKLKGATFNKAMQKWISQIGFNYQVIHIGCFDTEIDAHSAYLVKAQELFGEFARAA